MGKLTISMAIFNSYVSLPEGNSQYDPIMMVKYLECYNRSVILLEACDFFSQSPNVM